MTTPQEFRVSRQRTTNPNLNRFEAIVNASLGLGEIGELQNIIKKEWFHGHDPQPTEVLDEAGDVLFYLDWLLEEYGFTLEDAMQYNKNKLERRYPDGFTHAASRERTE